MKQLISPFELYCNKLRSKLETQTQQASSLSKAELVRRWTDLSKNKKSNLLRKAKWKSIDVFSVRQILPKTNALLSKTSLVL